MFYKGSAISGNGGGSITVDQTYDPTSPNAQSGMAVAEAVATITEFTGATSSVAGSAGLVPAPAATDNDKYLKGDGTWSAVSGGGLQNEATAANSISILGGDTTYEGSLIIGEHASVYGKNAIAIGCEDEDFGGTHANVFGTAIGGGMQAGTGSIAIGFYQDVGNYSIGLNAGTSNSKEFVVGYDDQNGDRASYLLLDLATGKIPNDRINVDVSPTSGSTNFVTSGTIYSVLGDIETLLAAI